VAATSGAVTTHQQLSTQENNIMSTSKNDMNDLAASKTYAAINRSIKTLDLSAMDEEDTVLGATFATHLDQLVTVYNAVKPLIAVLTTIPLIPKAWRAAIALFNKSLDAVVTAVPEFKAGKDL
jgi:hypothetical protein